MAYVEPCSPLTTETRPSSRTPFSFAGAGKLNSRPIGALLGAVAAGVFHLLKPELMGDGWAEGAFLIFCMTAGDLLQRLIHWGAGWHIDPKLRHLASTREAKLQFAKLGYYRHPAHKQVAAKPSAPRARPIPRSSPPTP